MTASKLAYCAVGCLLTGILTAKDPRTHVRCRKEKKSDVKKCSEDI
jgi:hypothetical protein